MAIKYIIVSLVLLQVIFAATGTTNINCGGITGVTCSSACTNFALPQGCSYSGNTPSCVVAECNCATSNTKLTDSYCASCKGANYFANTAQTQCVQPKNSCINRGSTAWTVEDCNTCNGKTKSKVVDKKCRSGAAVLITTFISLLMLLF